MLLTCLLKFTIQVPFAQQKSVNSLLRLSFTLPVSFFHFTNARLSLCWSENFKPVLMSCIPIYLIYGRLLIRFWKVQQNNFQTYSFNQSCTGVQHLICQRVLNICICSCICHICVSTLKLLPCVQLMYYSYLQWGEHLNAPHPCLSLSAVHAKGVSWHLVRLSASYVLTGFVVFTAVVWYI